MQGCSLRRSQGKLTSQRGQRAEQSDQWLTSGSCLTFLEKLSQSGATLFISSFIMMQKPPTYTQRSPMWADVHTNMLQSHDKLSVTQEARLQCNVVVKGS